MTITKPNYIRRHNRHRRVRAKITGTASRPRVAVFRSNRNIFVQVIDDQAGKTLISNQIDGKKPAANVQAASKIGQAIAAEMKKKGIETAVFDRGGFQYHGRVKAVADGLREGGINL